MKFILFILLLANSIYPQERRFLFRDPVIQSSDAFTMLGDSRTQYVFQFGVEVDWENQVFLGKYKTSCSEGKIGIQNAGVAGSTT